MTDQPTLADAILRLVNDFRALGLDPPPRIGLTGADQGAKMLSIAPREVVATHASSFLPTAGICWDEIEIAGVKIMWHVDPLRPWPAPSNTADPRPQFPSTDQGDTP